MNYNSLKETINANIKQNGNQEITGIVMNSVLNAMVNALAASGMTFGGAITPSTPVPTNIDQATAFLAPGAGTYEHFLDSNGDPIVVTSPSLIMYDGGQALVFTAMTLPFPQVLSVSGGNSLIIPIPDFKNSYRIDMTAQYTGGLEERYIGSLIIECNDLAMQVAHGYYYGDDMAEILSECAIWKNDPEMYPEEQGYSLLLTTQSDLDEVIFSVSALDGKSVQMYESNEDEKVKVADATITPVGSGGGDGKMGVISQTQTWSGTGSNPRTYVMSNPVTGLIPQANIDLFESAGATFNESTGYFELNGLTDISYEEMRAIYDTTIGLVPCRDRTIGLLGTTSPRATLPMRGTTSFASAIAYFAYGMQNLEQITFDQFVYNTAANQTIMAFRNCFCLKAIYGYLRLYSTTNDADIFTNCYSLESVRINYLRGSIALKQSSLLSLTSVVYMVENAANTSAITITLHATAYARCQADTTEYTYQGNTYTGIIAYANARNITIASA